MVWVSCTGDLHTFVSPSSSIRRLLSAIRASRCISYVFVAAIVAWRNVGVKEPRNCQCDAFECWGPPNLCPFGANSIHLRSRQNDFASAATCPSDQAAGNWENFSSLKSQGVRDGLRNTSEGPYYSLQNGAILEPQILSQITTLSHIPARQMCTQQAYRKGRTDCWCGSSVSRNIKSVRALFGTFQRPMGGSRSSLQWQWKARAPARGRCSRCDAG